MKHFAQSSVVFLVLVTSARLAGQDPSPKAIAFTHVQAVDVVAGRVLTDMTVVIAGDRIVAMGQSESLRPPSGVQVIDATGKFLIPGLWDMHVHAWGGDEDFLSLFVANGVTGIRIMIGGPLHRGWRKSIESGTLLGPRMVIATRLIDGPNSIMPNAVIVRNESEARAAVRTAKTEGADFVKVYDRLSREAYLAIADEAKSRNLSFAGHIPFSVSATEASDIGQRSNEHLRGIIETASGREDEVRAARLAGTITDAAARGIYRETFSVEKAETLMLRFKKNQTWQTPTLTVLRGEAFVNGQNLRTDPRLKYLPAQRRSEWERSADQAQRRAPQAVDFFSWRWQKYVELVGLMGRAGVPILAGTDSANPWCLPGFGLHDELELLVQAGLTQANALQSATINAARFLGRESDLGTVEKGKIADLILLDGNPLADVRNTTRIRAVVANGKLMDRAALDTMLSEVEKRSLQ